MSIVDNCILSFNILEDDERISEVNSFFISDIEKPFVSVDADFLPIRWYGGNKFLETPLFIAAFNHFREADFVEHLKTINWREPEEVQLIIKRQYEDKFSIVEISK